MWKFTVNVYIIPILERVALFIKKSKQFIQRYIAKNIAALTLKLSEDGLS